jgi:ribosomal protein L37AE/L43A
VTAAYYCLECKEALDDQRGSLGIRNCRSCAGLWVQKARRAGRNMGLVGPGRLPTRDYQCAAQRRRVN